MQIFNDLKHFLQNSAQKKSQSGVFRPFIAILGPTASGKTALSLKIAKMFDGEIISADSRQVYKFMDIGTDKILEAEQQGIPHHMLDILEPDEEFTLADFKKLGLKAIEDIERRHKIPILVGGTGLYFNAIMQNYQIPSVPPNAELRRKLNKFAEENGAEALHAMLRERDPQAAAGIHPNNVRYVIRALEINIAGKIPKIDTKGEPVFDVFTIGISWPREALYARIDRRVDRQIERGLIDETKSLLERGFSEKLPSMSSLGYPEIIAYIREEIPLEKAVETIKKNTRNYAKRQMTWFRQYGDIHWLDGQELETFLKKH